MPEEDELPLDPEPGPRDPDNSYSQADSDTEPAAFVRISGEASTSDGANSSLASRRLADPVVVRDEPAPARSKTPRRGRQSRSRPVESGSVSRSLSQNDGADLERRVARTEFNDGALVRLRVPIRIDAESGRDVLTDIDVLAIDVDGRLRVSRSILECKSGKGQSGEPDRLLWLAGLQKYLGFGRAVLVRQTVSRRGRDLARALGLRTLDVRTLIAREATHAWLPERFAHVDGPECVAAELRTDIQLKGLGHLSAELVGFLRYDALRAKPHECLRAVAALGRVADRGGVLPSPTRLVLAGHALVALLSAAVSDAGRLDEMLAIDLLERTERALVTGNPDDSQVLATLARADELTTYALGQVHDAYQSAGAKRLQLTVPSLRDVVATPPTWVSLYVDLVEKLRANSATARQMLQTAELAVFEAMVGGTAHEATAFDHLFTADHRYLLNVARRCLSEIAGVGVADALAPVLDLNFSRGGGGVTDRDVPAT